MAIKHSRFSIRRLGLALSACAALSPALSSAQNAPAEAPLKVGFVYVSPVSEAGWTHQHDQGRKQMQAALGSKVATTFVENVAEGADAERVIRDLAQTGHKLIFTTSFGYMNPTEKVAKEFPQTVFMHASGYKSSANMGNYNARFYEARYVTGVIAGKMSKSGQVGYVAAFPIPEVMQGINAFTMGLRSVNPKAQVRVVWVNTWFDPVKEREAANALVSQGADILTHHTDSTAVAQAAQEKGVQVMGYHTDISKLAPKAHLAAATHHWGKYYTQVTQSVLNGSWKTAQVWGGTKDGFVRVEGFHANLPADVKKLALGIEAEIASGKRHPFQGPITTQDGVLKQRVGTTMNDQDMNGMNYFVQGVVGTLPKK
jgi:basic membrane protein A and related proteins